MSDQVRKRLSPVRVLVALILVVGLLYQGREKVEELQQVQPDKSYQPWFAPYVDVTATPRYAFEHMGTTTTPDAILSFIVASGDDRCQPSWGNAYSLDQANIELDLERRIARLRQQGGDIAISFGGLFNEELAVACTDEDKLKTAYRSVIDRYQLTTIDLDLEGNSLSDGDAALRRARVLSAIQKDRQNNGQSLAIWLTLPVAPFGLTEQGTTAISILLKNGVDLAGVNVMTMDYGESKEQKDSMGEASIKALKEAHRQLSIIYKQNGINLSSASIWTKLGATPMIGQNDVVTEVFALEDAELLNQFVVKEKIMRVSMWSANRDIQCSENYVDLHKVSDSCSGVKQDQRAFASLLSRELKGRLAFNADKKTEQDSPTPVPSADDPTTSPYQIWQETMTYLEGTKVVWHGNVYQAKWWTQGDLPDNPVLQVWETPWQIIGPVLIGEKPIPQKSIPRGIYPLWDGESIYDEGERVIFNGIPYQAKWWTKGDSPAASSSDAEGSPWVPLSQSEVDAIVKRYTERSS